MNRKRDRIIEIYSVFSKLLFVALLCLVPAADYAGAEEQDTDAFGNLPLCFVENRGQYDEAVLYCLRGSDRVLYFTSRGVTWSVTGTEDDEALRWTVKTDFVDCSPDIVPRGEEPQKAVFSYFRGKPADWKTGIRACGRLVYDDLWPGIDLVFAGGVNLLKYEFVVAPGADRSRIRLRCRGAEDLSVNAEGELVMATPLGPIVDGAPFAYQLIDGERKEVSMAFSEVEEEAGEFTYGFDVGPHDATVPLVLDPSMMIYCGYIGGSQEESGLAVAVDANRNAYVAGKTWSDDFPTTVGPDLSFNGSSDAFVAKVDASGTGLVYCGYIGGDGGDQAYGIAVDGAGNAYVSGRTQSTEATFPVVVGPDLTHNGGTYDFDAFVACIDVAGTGLVYCGYIGGDEDDSAGNAIAVDSAGAAYVTGHTRSTEATFPVTLGPDLSHNGSLDVFVAKVNPQGSGLDYCGYIGGDGTETGEGIAVDGAGRAYVTGSVSSQEGTFPVTVGPDLTHNGNSDAFVARVNAIGAGLEYCGYIGGDDVDESLGIGVDPEGGAYITGWTRSYETSFPVVVGPDLTFNGSDDDAFVAKVNAQGSGLDYCGYIGGSLWDFGYDIAVDHDGHAYVTGKTFSTQASFPVKYGPDLTFNGSPIWEDGFVAMVNASGIDLTYCGYIGGDQRDVAQGIGVDDRGDAYVTGWTNCDQATFPVTVGPDLTFNGGGAGGYEGDAFIAKVASPAPVPDIKVNGYDDDVALPHSTPLVITVSLDPGSSDGTLADWWIFVEMNFTHTFWWQYPGSWTFSTSPKSVFKAPFALREINNATIDSGTVPAGIWEFAFAVDAPDTVYEGTYEDTITVTVYY